MADLCRRLRDAREAGSLTIEQISARTKITAASLRALEAGDFSRLPGEFYTRAFLKTYARELGLPADELVREYDESRRPPQPPVSVQEESSQEFVAELASPRHASPPFVLRVPSVSGAWARVAFAVLLLAFAGLAVRQFSSARRGEPGAVGTAGVVEAAPAPVGTSGHAAALPEKLTIDIRPTAPIWVAATADGNSVIYRVLKPGEQVVVEARKEFSFRIGNAAAFVYAVNGMPGKPLGGPDEVREFDITRENYLTFRR